MRQTEATEGTETEATEDTETETTEGTGQDQHGGTEARRVWGGRIHASLDGPMKILTTSSCSVSRRLSPCYLSLFLVRDCIKPRSDHVGACLDRIAIAEHYP
jgi:hypothetical protein